MNYRNILHISSLVLILTAFASCTSDDGPKGYGEPVKGTFTISSATRAEEEDESGGKELINDWFMIFTEVAEDSEGKEIPGAIRHVEGPHTIGAVRQDAVSLELPSGEYFVFAFANIDMTEVAKCLGLAKGFVEGEVIPSDFLQRVWSNTKGYNGWDDNIPMSGVRRVKVTERVHEPYSIEVVRMLAKLEFKFTNRTSYDISLNSITMKPVCQGPTMLFGNYDGNYLFQKNNPPTIPEKAVYDAFQIPGLADGFPIGKGESQRSLVTYMMESVPDDHASGHFHLEFSLNRGSNGPESLYALVGKVEGEGEGDLSYITRNNHIVIPVTFTDWEASFEVRFYPPIGGYPAVSKEEVGNEFYFKFATQGHFVITPRIRRINEDGTKGDWLTHDKIKDLKVEVISGEEIFETTPSADEKTGEITGYLGVDNLGTSEVRITFTLPEEEGKTPLSPVKRIYIIRE